MTWRWWMHWIPVWGVCLYLGSCTGNYLIETGREIENREWEQRMDWLVDNEVFRGPTQFNWLYPDGCMPTKEHSRTLPRGPGERISL